MFIFMCYHFLHFSAVCLCHGYRAFVSVCLLDCLTFVSRIIAKKLWINFLKILEWGQEMFK